MNGFLVTMLLGLFGLVLMALPGLSRHGARGAHLAKGHARGGKLSHHARGPMSRLLPEPRTILSLLVLFGAFGNLFEKNTRLSPLVAGLVALVPALFVEIALVGPVWRFFLRFAGQPSSPMTALVLEQGRAVTPFRNGRGMVEVVRDGRSVQLVAELSDAAFAAQVKVGDKLRIDDVDAERERVKVSVV